MARFRRYFKSLGRRKYKSRRWRNFSRYNYNNVKIDCNFHVQYPQSSGFPQIFFSSDTGMSGKYFSLGNLLEQHSDWATYKPLYQLYRLRGIKLEATPMSCNAGQEGITQSSGVYLGWCIVPIGEQNQTEWLTTTDRAMVLNPLQKTSKYWSTFGMQDDWKTTTMTLGGNLSVYSSESSTLNTAPIWHVKATFYISCKMANK